MDNQIFQILILTSILLFFYLLSNLVRFVHKAWWTPARIQAAMASQGIVGPPFKFPHGNSKEVSAMRSQSMVASADITHDLFPRIHPHVYLWMKTYGRNFLYWHGSQGRFLVTEPELVKEIFMNRDGFFPKMETEGYMKKLLGESLITNEGEKWAKVRKLANRTFHAESLSGMVPEMCSSVSIMLERWKSFVGKEMDVCKEFGLLTTEVISRTAFGNSYMEGKNIFEMVAKLTAITVRNITKVRFPLTSWIHKSGDEVEAENLEKSKKRSILEIIKKREMAGNGEARGLGMDFLSELVRATREADEKKRITVEQMIDEVGTLYGAGHLTTTTLLSWCIMLLATDQNWQETLRKEVNDTFPGCQNVNSDGISRLKTMNMVINECLRLYPPVLTLTRQTSQQVKLGNLLLPPNVKIFISILALHYNPRIWGQDVHLFKPDRFEHGVAKATGNVAAAFMPFGMGPRTCVGLNFTTNEAKIALAMILQRFKFTLSSNYVHHPAEVFILTPKNGVQIVLEAV